MGKAHLIHIIGFPIMSMTGRFFVFHDLALLIIYIGHSHINIANDTSCEKTNANRWESGRISISEPKSELVT